MKKLLTLISMVVLVAIVAVASMVTFNKTSNPVSQQVDLKNSRNATLFGKYGGMKVETGSRRAAAMNEYGLITEPDEGETHYYTISGSAYVVSDSEILETEQSGIAAVVYCDDNTVYMKPIVSNYSSGVWVKGSVVDNTLVFPIGQPVAYNANWKTTLSVYWGETNSFSKVEEQTDIVFEIVDDGLVLQNSSSELFLGIFWDDDNSWTWSGVFGTVLTLNTEYKPASTELVVLPEGAEIEDWYAMGEGTSGTPQNIKVAFVENEVYISGLSDYFSDSWIKGTIDGTTVTFPSLQFVGQYGSYNIWAMGFNWNDEVQPAFTMSYDAETGTFVLDENQLLAFNADENRLYFLSYYWTLVLTKDASIYNAYINLKGAISQARELLNNAIITRDGINILNEAIDAASQVLYSCDVNAMTVSYEELNRVIAQVQETEIRTISVWTIAGSSEILGSLWDVTDTNNDMIEDEYGTFVLSKKNIELIADVVYEFKVAGDHSWDINYGQYGQRDGQNVLFTVGETGIYNVNFYFYPNNYNELSVTCELISTGKQEELIYSIDYSNYRGFPFYVMGYVPEFDNGWMTDCGAMYGYKTDDDLARDAEEGIYNYTEVGTVITSSGTIYHKVLYEYPAWHQYFIADGIPTEFDGKYVVKAMMKASEPCNVDVNMRWSWGEEALNASVYVPDEWTEVEWVYEGIGGTSCLLVAQPGSCTATIDWQWLKVYNIKEGEVLPVEWIEYLTNGDAEKSWEEMGLADVRWNDAENNYKVSAWGRVKGENIDYDTLLDKDNWCPFPANIEVDPDDPENHVFVVHATYADSQDESGEGYDVSAWDNQFWIQSPKEWKTGDLVKIHFRYKASQNATTGTQVHRQTPMEYLNWQGVGDVNFTTEWQEFDGIMTVNEYMSGAWSLAFNLNTEVKDAVDFYFDDLSWQVMKLDEGFFVAGENTKTGLYYDFGNAIEFVYAEDYECYTAIIGEFGEPDSWVNKLMISTVRGDDQAFRTHTIKVNGNITGNPDQWYDYSEVSNAKISLPAEGVWQVYLDPQTNEIAFEMLEGRMIDPIDVVTNQTVVTVYGKEREYTEAEAEALGIERPDNPGQPWDNQFFIVANRKLEAGEKTVIEFDYVANKYAKTTTQTHGAPGAYIHWAAIGSLDFDTEWQHFEMDFTIPSEAEGKDAQSIAFNMAEIKEACNYTITNIRWYVMDDYLDWGQTYENLIDAEGTQNFWVKEGAGTSPYQFGDILMGDVDSNGQVNVTDAVLIIDDILGKNPWNFNATAADVNYDSDINVTDVVLVIDHILGKTNLNPNRAAAVDGEVGTISLSTDMTTVSLTNPSAYTAFQMDVTLPMGVSLENAQLTERAAGSHSVVIRKLDNGSYRIIGVSMQNEAFEGTVGELLKLQLSGNAQGAVAINNVLFVTPQGVQHELAGVNAFGDVTGISDALRLNDNGQLINDNVFDLQGRRLSPLTSHPSPLKKGLYILDGKKQVVK